VNYRSSGVAGRHPPSPLPSRAIDLYVLQREKGGVVLNGGRSWQGPGPGHSARDKSLRVDLLDDGKPLVVSFSGDDFASCARYLGIEQERFSHRPQRARNQPEWQRGGAAPVVLERTVADFCETFWVSCVSPAQTIAQAYLRSRGIYGDWADLRFHPSAPTSYEGSRTLPAMVGLVRAADGCAIGLHATHLRADGSSKALDHRLMFGAVGGGAVRLSTAAAEMAVGEGIETSAAFALLNDLPAWAGLSSGGLGRFEPPAIVRHLIVAADPDDAGMQAADRLALRLQRRCDVTIVPAPGGMDWADVLKESRR
jgi:putative DNA primase/helicase